MKTRIRPRPARWWPIGNTISTLSSCIRHSRCARLREAIAAAEGVRPENVFCGNGSDEVLALCFPAFFDADGAGAAFADVTYSFYPVFCEFFGIPHTIVPLEEDFTQDLSKLTAARAQGVLVANPNAPTGIGIPLGQIEPFVAANAGRGGHPR